MQKQTSFTLIPIPFAITTSSDQATMQSQFGNHLLLSSLNRFAAKFGVSKTSFRKRNPGELQRKE